MDFFDEKFVDAASAGDTRKMESIWNWVSTPFNPNYCDPISVHKLDKLGIFAIFSEGIQDAFVASAWFGHTETMLKIWELAKDKIEDDYIGEAFKYSAGDGHTEILLKIWELAKDKIEDDYIGEAFQYSASRGHTETMLKIWELAKDKISDYYIGEAFQSSASRGHTEALLKIWELAKDKIEDDYIGKAFESSVGFGHTETMLKIWELAKDKISDYYIGQAFKYSAGDGHTEILLKIWELAKDKISNKKIEEAFEYLEDEGNTEIIRKIRAERHGDKSYNAYDADQCNLEIKQLKEKGHKFFQDLKSCPSGGDSLLQGQYVSKKTSEAVAKCNHNALTKDVVAAKDIPLTTHHIWLTNPENPKELSDHMLAWAKKSAAVLSGNANWKNIFWVNEKKLIPNTVKELEKVGCLFKEIYELGPLQLEREYSSAMSASKFGLASDILRYEILDKLGGLYFDTDYDLLADPYKLHGQVDFYTGIEPFGKFKAGNAIIGAKPNHPIIKNMMEHIKQWTDQNTAPKFLKDCSNFDQTIYITGPFGFTKAYLEHSNVENNIDVVLQPSSIYSMHYQHNGGANFNPRDKVIDHLDCKEYCTPMNANNEELALGYHYWANAWAKSEFGSHG